MSPCGANLLNLNNNKGGMLFASQLTYIDKSRGRWASFDLMKGRMKEIRTSLTARTLMALVITGLGWLLPQVGFAEGIPALKVLEGNEGGTEYSLSLQLIIVMTLLSLLPSILILMTSFTRIIIVLSLLRQAMGTAQTPPNQVLIGIALFLTLFIMNPILQTIYDDALEPVQNEEITFNEGLDRARVPLQQFMLGQTREKDMVLFMEMSDTDPVEDVADLP